jgi:hypothetical protein
VAIAPDANGSTAVTAAAQAATVDITAAAAGAWCYLWCAISTASTTQAGVPSSASWTTLQSVQTASGTSGACYAVYRRQKQAGDTTFSFTWTANAKGVFAWASYAGLNSTPDEQSAIALNDTTSRAGVPTPSATPSNSNRWALAFFGQRSTTTGNRPTAWTHDAALTERKEADNSAAASSPWLGADIEDSNGPVTQAAHSYTATSNQTESHDGSAILFLIPLVTETLAAAPHAASAVRRGAGKPLAAGPVSHGTLSRAAGKKAAAIPHAAGAMQRATVAIRHAAPRVAGALSRHTGKSVAATPRPGGNLARTAGKALAAAPHPAGAVRKTAAVTRSAPVTVRALMVAGFPVTLAAAARAAGNLARTAGKRLGAAPHAQGALARRTGKRAAATAHAAAGLAHGFAVVLAAAVTTTARVVAAGPLRLFAAAGARQLWTATAARQLWAVVRGRNGSDQ